MHKAQKALRKFASPQKARSALKFFKTGPGQYGEGDRFIGATVPEVRLVAKKFLDMNFKDLSRLMRSPIHEDRLLALVILTHQYAKAKELKDRRKLFAFYLKIRKGINNWDLVDVSAPNIPGAHSLKTNDIKPLIKLANSKRHWDRRIAMVSTLTFIRSGNLNLVWRFAKQFLTQEEDLMHKATGWMLREAGQRDAEALRKFIAVNGDKMPRTMLRYAIEKFSAGERARILKSTRN